MVQEEVGHTLTPHQDTRWHRGFGSVDLDGASGSSLAGQVVTKCESHRRTALGSTSRARGRQTEQLQTDSGAHIPSGQQTREFCTGSSPSSEEGGG